MTRIASVLLPVVSLSSCGPGNRGTMPCLTYEPDTVELTGVLQHDSFPGPPGFSSIASGDAVEVAWFVLLPRAICTVGDTASADAYPVASADTVQVVMDSAGLQRLRMDLGRSITLTGTLFARHTGHHHAPLLMDVIGPH